MRNRFGGSCYRCQEWVVPGDGHFERLGRSWRVQHAQCAINFRGIQDAERAAYQKGKDERKAEGTGKSAQRARRRLRVLASHGASDA